MERQHCFEVGWYNQLFQGYGFWDLIMMAYAVGATDGRSPACRQMTNGSSAFDTRHTASLQ